MGVESGMALWSRRGRIAETMGWAGPSRTEGEAGRLVDLTLAS